MIADLLVPWWLVKAPLLCQQLCNHEGYLLALMYDDLSPWAIRFHRILSLSSISSSVPLCNPGAME